MLLFSLKRGSETVGQTNVTICIVSELFFLLPMYGITDINNENYVDNLRKKTNVAHL